MKITPFSLRMELIEMGWSSDISSKYIGNDLKDFRIRVSKVYPNRGLIKFVAKVPFYKFTEALSIMKDYADMYDKKPLLVPEVVFTLNPVDIVDNIDLTMDGIEYFMLEEMNKKGWAFKDSIQVFSGRTKLYRNFGFEKYKWHGVNLGAPVRVANLTELINRDYEDFTAINTLMSRALRAYEDFPTSIPRQEGNKMIEDTLITSLSKFNLS